MFSRNEIINLARWVHDKQCGPCRAIDPKSERKEYGSHFKSCRHCALTADWLLGNQKLPFSRVITLIHWIRKKEHQNENWSKIANIMSSAIDELPKSGDDLIGMEFDEISGFDAYINNPPFVSEAEAECSEEDDDFNSNFQSKWT